MTTRSLLAISLVALLGACATPNIGDEYVLDERSGNGVVVGSITYIGSHASYAVSYRRLPDGSPESFRAGTSASPIPMIPKSDFDERHFRGSLVVAELKAGEYEVTRWFVSGPAIVSPTVPFRITFRVEPGKAVYLGNFEFRQTAGFGLTVTGAEVTYQDSSQRDLFVLQRKYPKIAQVPVSSAIPKGTIVQKLGGQYRSEMTIPIFLPVK